MSALDPVAGYPVHAVATFRRWSNPHGVKFTDWTAVCGASATETGSRPFAQAGRARRAELCPECWPSRSWTDRHPEPREVSS